MFLALALAPAAGAAPLKIATDALDGGAWMVQMKAAAATIATRTGGRVQLKFYPGGSQGNDSAVRSKMRIGQLHGAMLTIGSLGETYPDSRIWGLPMLFRTQDEVDFVRQEFDPVFNKGLEAAGLVGFGFADGGFASVMSTVAVRSIPELKSQKVWAPQGDPVSYALMKELGVSPITLSAADVVTGLQTGLVNTVANSPLGALAFQWHTKVRFVTDVPLVYLGGILVIDKRAFDRIEAADQAVLREVLTTTFRGFNVQNRLDDASARSALTKAGVQFITPTADELTRWQRAADAVATRLVAEGQFDGALFKRFQDRLARYRAGAR
jgi:TRAP-type C4-dicarboxylate transport system substrate-binding protein